MAVVDPPREIVEALAIPDHWDASVFIFEADTETWDEREGGGVQLVALKEYLIDIYEYYGPSFLFIWRSIVINDGNAADKFWENHPQFSNWLLTQRGKGYKTKKRELARSVIGTNRNQDIENLFCSELVALAYQELNLLKKHEDGGKRANNYVPRDFSSTQTANGRDIELLGDAYFEKERRIKLRNPPVQLTVSQPSITLETEEHVVAVDNLSTSSPSLLPTL